MRRLIPNFVPLALIVTIGCGAGTVIPPEDGPQNPKQDGNEGTNTGNGLVALALAIPASSSPSSGSLELTDNASNTMVITKAAFVVHKIEYTRTDLATCVGEIEDCGQFQIGPFAFDVPLETTPTVVLLNDLVFPNGLYGEFEFEIEADSSDLFVDVHPAFADETSLVAEGTFNGNNFVYTTSLEAEIETELDPPLTVDEVRAFLTLTVNVGAWFVDAQGQLIDPNTAQGGPNTLLVENNIRASMDAFQDDDQDGSPDLP